MDISYGDVFERDRIELNLIIKDNNEMCLGTFSWMSFFKKKKDLKRICFGYHIFRQTQSIRVLEAHDED